MYLLGAILAGAFGFVYFTLMNTAVPVWMFVAIVLFYVPRDLVYGPQAALIAECFPARLRYSGCSFGHNLASVIAGGPAPLIATALLAAFGSGYAVTAYILFCAIVSIVTTGKGGAGVSRISIAAGRNSRSRPATIGAGWVIGCRDAGGGGGTALSFIPRPSLDPTAAPRAWRRGHHDAPGAPGGFRSRRSRLCPFRRCACTGVPPPSDGR